MIKRISRLFGFGGVDSDYDAVDRNANRRIKKPRTRVRSEDRNLRGRSRERLTSNAQNLQRNFSLAAWIIRKHLDYVTAFNFQAKTGNAEFDIVLESFIADWSKRQNFDVAHRHRLSRALRMAEARRVVDGDILVTKVATPPGSKTRGRVQFIEADRICLEPEQHKKLPGNWENGVKVNRKTGQAMAYAICNRDDNGRKVYSHTIAARSAYLHAYYDSIHRFDMVRGISPIASSLNQLRDTYEGFDLILARLKVNQLFGLKITRTEDTDSYAGYSSQPVDPNDKTVPHDGDDNTDDGYDIDLTGLKNFQLDMEPGEDAEFLEAKTPSNESIAFLGLMIQVSLKSLDIPMSFFSEDLTNFYGSRGALLHYLRSAASKIEDNQELLGELTRWRLGMAVFDEELQIPSGMGFDDLQFEWVPRGVPFWDTLKEAKGHLMAISGALDNPFNIARQNGTDLKTNIEKIAEAQEYAKTLGVTLDYSAGAKPTQQPDPTEPADANA